MSPCRQQYSYTRPLDNDLLQLGVVGHLKQRLHGNAGIVLHKAVNNLYIAGIVETVPHTMIGHPHHLTHVKVTVNLTAEFEIRQWLQTQ